MILSKAEGENATLRVTGLSEAVTTVAPNLSVNAAGVLQRTSGGADGGIGEAPIDGKEYARKDAAWSEVDSLWTDVDGVAVYDGNIESQ